MKFRLKPKTINAIQWKGWPHRIKGILQNPTYPQLGWLSAMDSEVYKGDWVLTFSDGDQKVMNDYEFSEMYERVK